MSGPMCKTLSKLMFGTATFMSTKRKNKVTYVVEDLRTKEIKSFVWPNLATNRQVFIEPVARPA